jgi:GTP-binding protein
MFIDQVEILVKAGGGGNGCTSFRREKHVPRGGPNGGDGGKGGSVFLYSDSAVATLLDFANRAQWNACRGGDGMGKNMSGKNGDDLIIHVPLGTVVYDLDRKLVIKDMDLPAQTICVAHGGRGGKGNKRFATAVNQTPYIAEDGKPGGHRHLKLELKLIADIGLVGLPNAGKSTLLSRISAARPKIAPYPFTTLQPNLGIVELTDYRRFVAADIPGLIEGSHKGEGLGHDFLRHIERTRIIVHLVDVAATDGSDAIQNYHTIRQELAKYSPVLAEKTEIVVVSKMDLDADGKKLDEFQKNLGREVTAISSVTGRGLKELTELLWREIQKTQTQPPKTDSPPMTNPPHLSD